MKKLFGLLLLLGVTLALPALAQTADTGALNVNLGEGLLSSRRIFQILIITTVLSLAPSILLMVTSFTRIIIVFSFLRTAMGLQSSPPNSVLVSLALFLTMFIMAPTFEAAYNDSIQPYINQEIDEDTAFELGTAPFARFMLANVNEGDLNLFTNLLPDAERDAIDVVTDEEGTRALTNVPLRALVPGFMISELRRAFEIGFLLYLPFIIIDLTIASILMSMGMMMLPPVIISLPFKVIFFVLVDGWRLLSGTLVESFRIVG